MHLVLHVSTIPNGTFHGTARRSSDDTVIDFHGVLELVAVIDRLLADEPGRTGEQDDDG